MTGEEDGVEETMMETVPPNLALPQRESKGGAATEPLAVIRPLAMVGWALFNILSVFLLIPAAFCSYVATFTMGAGILTGDFLGRFGTVLWALFIGIPGLLLALGVFWFFGGGAQQGLLPHEKQREWILVNVGGNIAALVGSVFSFLLLNDSPLWWERVISGGMAGMAGGLLMGVLQWGILRDYYSQAVLWLMTTPLGWELCFGVLAEVRHYLSIHLRD